MPIGLADSAILLDAGGGLRAGDGRATSSIGITNAPGTRSGSVFILSVSALTHDSAIAALRTFVSEESLGKGIWRTSKSVRIRQGRHHGEESTMRYHGSRNPMPVLLMEK